MGNLFIAKAQNELPLKDYTINIWSNREGLPSNNLSHVLLDKTGYLWISTFDGAMRFDGNKFKTFDSKNVSELSTSAFYASYSLPDSSILFLTQSSGLLHFKNGEFLKLYENTILPNNLMVAYLSKQDRLWIGSSAEGLFYIDKGEVKKYHIPEFENTRISAITFGIDNSIWVTTRGQGVANITDTGYTLFTKNDGLASNVVHTVLTVNSNIYFGTSQGLSLYKNNHWTSDERFNELEILTIIEHKGNLWLGTVLGLGRLSKSDDLEFISVEDGLPERTINKIVIDENNTIWLATYRGGLVQLKPSTVKNLTLKDGLSYHNINMVYETKEGHILVGNNEGGVDIIKDGKVTGILQTELFKKTIIKDILVEDDGTIWVASYKGITKINGKYEQCYTVANGLLSNKIRCLLKNNSTGDIWAGSRSGGINIMAKDGSIKIISKKEGLSSDFVFSLDYGANGSIVAGTAHGLNIIHENLEVEVINPNNIFDGKVIFNVYVENDSIMWIATNIGLYYFDNTHFYLIDYAKGLPAESIFDVLEDDNGYLWLTSIKGVIRINKEEAIQLAKGKIQQIEAILFDESDGMNTRECTGATQSLLASDGRIWVPTIKGVAIFDPNNIKLNSLVAPSAYIENIRIDDEPIDNYSGGHLDAKLIIEPGHRNYAIDYTVLGMLAPQKIRFKYILEGFDNDWNEVGIERQAKYTNLPYGDYTFRVKASNNNGTWNANESSIELSIIPFYYETKTFYVFVLLLFLILTYVIYRLQTKAINARNIELLRLNRELDSFAYSVSHDLKAPLASIQGLLNVARLDKSENALFYFNKIGKSVDRLNAFIKDITDYSKNARTAIEKEQVNIYNLVKEVKESLPNLHEKKEINCIVDINPDLVIETDKTRLIFIVNNLISNAFRYADLTKQKPFVKITSAIKDSNLVFSVIDNGQGIEKKYHKKIFDMFFRANNQSNGSGLGLYIVKESATKLGGKISLKSEIKRGTTIKLVLPLKH